MCAHPNRTVRMFTVHAPGETGRGSLRAIILAILLGALGTACGQDDQTPPELRQVALVLERTAYAPSNEETLAAGPVEILITLAGPDGTRTERSLSEENSLALDQLTPGRWQVSADGLDDNGHVGWSAPRTPFDVEAGQQTRVELTLTILP